MAITPDTKDWTWVLTRECPECGMTAAAVVPQVIATLAVGSLPAWQTVLGRPDVRDRPNPSTWSPLVYAAHVRDVFDLFADRIVLMCETDNPQFANWDQDATAIEKDYASCDPTVLAEELAASARRFADALRGVGDRWEREGRRSNGAVFTVATLAQYGWHDVAHHLHDIGA